MTDQSTDASVVEQERPSSGILARAQASTRTLKTGDAAEAWIFQFRDQVAELLTGRVRDPDAYLFNVYRTVAASDGLRTATASSLAAGILLGATLGLELGGPLGHYYLTPRWNSRLEKNECVPVIGYRGFFELGYRSGHVAAYEYVRVREGDEFDTWADSEGGQRWTYRKRADESAPLTHVVAITKLLNGQVTSLPMTIDEILRRRPTKWERTPWGKKEFADAMATKTPFREQAKFQRLSTDLALAAAADERVSAWNRQTQAIETRHDDADEGTLAGTDGIEPEPSAAPPSSAPQGSPRVDERRADPEPSTGRTASQDDAAPDDGDPSYRAWLESQQP